MFFQLRIGANYRGKGGLSDQGMAIWNIIPHSEPFLNLLWDVVTHMKYNRPHFAYELHLVDDTT